MQQRFHLFIRQHANDWLTAQVLTYPQYAAFGPKLAPLKEQLTEVLAQELAEGRISSRDQWFDDLKRRTIELELRAVQHTRLIRVPMRFSVLVRPLPDRGPDTFEVRLPRLGQTFTIAGEDNIVPWTEEIIRGHFHLDPVERLLPYQSARGERLDSIEVTWQTPKSKAARRRAARKSRREAQDEDADFLGWLKKHTASPLDEVGVELTAEARNDRLPRADFRDGLVDQLLSILDAAHNRSVLLTGPSGVGKTALVHEVAHRVAEGRVPLRLQGVPIWHVTGGRIIAGMKYLGEWQARCQSIVESIRAERGILYVDSPLELLTAGGGGTGLNVANFFLPAIRSGEITVIAESNPDALLLAEQAGPTFIAALRRVPVPPFSADVSRAILERAATRLEKNYRVRYTPAGLARALDVLARFGDAEALPGSGLRLIEQMARLPGEGGPRPKRGGPPPVLGPKVAVQAFARASGFSEALVDPDVLLDVTEVRDYFESRVVGQSDATDLLTNLILVIKASLDDPDRPLGSFLFMGPTGVGKTESALTLAEYLFGARERVIRFDMSEYGYPGSAARLVGVGRQEGDLTRKVREQPFCVLLLDEVEKADPEVFDILLQVLGEGRLTDGTGRLVRFRHAIIIMTSNLGASDKRRIGLGGTDRPHALAQHYRDAARAFFKPEFINRVDFLVPFGALEPEAVRGIARRMLDAGLKREGFTRRGIDVRYGEPVLDLLMTHGFDPRYGARPMKRAVEQRVLVPLSRRLLLVAADAERAETFDLYVHDERVAVVSSRGVEGRPAPRLAGLASEHEGLWRTRVREIRARLQTWEQSAMLRASREAGDMRLSEALAEAAEALTELERAGWTPPGSVQPPQHSAPDAATVDDRLLRLEWDLCLASLPGANRCILEVEAPSLHPRGRRGARQLCEQYREWAVTHGLEISIADAPTGYRLSIRGPAAAIIFGCEHGVHRLTADDDSERDVDLRVSDPELPSSQDDVVRSYASTPATAWDPVTEVEAAVHIDGLAQALDEFILARMCRRVAAGARAESGPAEGDLADKAD